jgi:hypothetical protein
MTDDACDLRHAEVNRRLTALEEGQRVRDERLYSRVNSIAESHAALTSTVAGMGKTLERVDANLTTLSNTSTARTIEDKSKGNASLLTLVLVIAGWAVTILLFALGVLKP